MNASQIHLALNHVPLFLSIIGGLVLLFGMIRKNDPIKFLSLYFMIAAALFTVPVYLTGEGAEEMVEELPGVSKGLIGEHEEMANIGLIIIIITGIAALFTLVVKKWPGLLRLALVICTIFSFASFGVMAQTAHLGGQIRHSEIRSGTATVNENGNESGENEDSGKNKESKEKDKDDD